MEGCDSVTVTEVLVGWTPLRRPSEKIKKFPENVTLITAYCPTNVTSSESSVCIIWTCWCQHWLTQHCQIQGWSTWSGVTWRGRYSLGPHLGLLVLVLDLGLVCTHVKLSTAKTQWHFVTQTFRVIFGVMLRKSEWLQNNSSPNHDSDSWLPTLVKGPYSWVSFRPELVLEKYLAEIVLLLEKLQASQPCFFPLFFLNPFFFCIGGGIR